MYVEGRVTIKADPSGHCYNLETGEWDIWKWPWFGNCPLEVQTTTNTGKDECTPYSGEVAPKLQTVNIIPVSDPKITANGRFEWPVRFKLQEPAVDDGWIVQEIDASYEKYDTITNTWVGVTPLLAPSSHVHYWEAWPVRKGKQTSHLTSDSYKYDDNYAAYLPEEKGRVIVNGTVKFYTGGSKHEELLGDVPYGEGWGIWKFYNPDTMAGMLPSTTTSPDFWDNCGTSHDIEYNWDGDTSWGYVRWGNSISQWGTP